jgi:hypothetical protein
LPVLNPLIKKAAPEGGFFKKVTAPLLVAVTFFCHPSWGLVFSASRVCVIVETDFSYFDKANPVIAGLDEQE